MTSISPFLWFDNQAEEAANFYVSVFPNSEVRRVVRYPDGGPAPAGSVMQVTFTVDGLEMHALNGGPAFRFTEAISLFVQAETQEVIDRYWQALTTDGGEPSKCGWLKDKYGLSWQIVPPRLGELLADPDQARAERVMRVMLGQTKIVIAELEAA